MILAVDIGNSNIVLGCFENEQILFTERLSTNQNSTELEYTILIKNILELNNLNHRTFEGCIISSVVPSVTHTMEAAMRRLTGKAVMVVGPGIRNHKSSAIRKIHNTQIRIQCCKMIIGNLRTCIRHTGKES